MASSGLPIHYNVGTAGRWFLERVSVWDELMR
jgi:hypothetical protein